MYLCIAMSTLDDITSLGKGLLIIDILYNDIQRFSIQMLKKGVRYIDKIQMI